MNKYKTFEELKEELGDKFEEYMYKANIELLNKLDKIKEVLNEERVCILKKDCLTMKLDKILEEIE